jgi:L-2-hydroxyglutarate oxidase LhgO
LDTNITIIGAGVIGLAIAKKLSESFSEIFILEKNKNFGQEISSRNSEVIHSGIYYPTHSLKAELCVKGNKLLYNYCLEKNINHKKIGKLVVASEDKEIKNLHEVLNQSKINGVQDGVYLTKDEAIKFEPNIFCKAAIYFPSTGIIDTHGLMKQMETDAIKNNATLVYNSEVIGIKKITDGYIVTVKELSGEYKFSTKTIINASGLNADIISKKAGTYEASYQLFFWKGDYFAVGNKKNKMINHLIYPVPKTNITGLGVHATLDLNHGMKLGPDATFLESKNLDYSVKKEKQAEFFKAAKKYLPFLEEKDLHPDQAGIRPKLQNIDDPFRDFIIKKETEKGHPSFINLIGIESPGLTSCLAIAEEVKKLLKNEKK